MLVNSDRVADQFRIVFRGLVTGLDVFPLSTVDVSNEAKELVELITRQARKAGFEFDPEDKKAVKDIMRILNHFEEGTAPDPIEIKWILNHMGIHKWSDCNKEVKFLDSEIQIEFSNRESEKELELLSSLMGFMSYCRCVIFDSVDIESQHLNSQCNNGEALKGINGDDLRCPISLEMMSDPVTLSTGHTYDRSSILKWLGSGNATCPKTGEKLSSTELVQNLVLKGVIQQYCAENGVSNIVSSRKKRDISRTAMAGSLAGEGAVHMLAAFLVNKVVNGSVEEMNKAAFEIRVLTKTSIFNRSCLVESGVIPHLLVLLLSEDPDTQENSIAALLNLSKHSKRKGVIVEKEEGLNLIVHVLTKGLKIEAQQHAAATLFYLASVEKNRILIGENPEAIPRLVELIKNGNDRCKRNALVAIFGLLVHPGNHWKVLDAGVVPLLLNLLKDSEREDLVTDSLAVLSTLAEKVDGTVAILRRGGVLQLLVGILNTSTSRTGKEYCVSLLLTLCVNGGLNVVARLVKNYPSLMGSLYSQLSEGTPRASKKASAIIGILHQFHEKTSSASGSVTPVLPRERFVHVW